MQVDIRGRLAPTDAIRTTVERRVAFALGRFGSRIGHVTVWLSDLNGPRGGIDKSCQLNVGLVPAGQVVVEDSDVDLYAAISRAAERAGRAVAREFARRREQRLVRAGSPAAAGRGDGRW